MNNGRYEPAGWDLSDLLPDASETVIRERTEN